MELVVLPSRKSLETRDRVWSMIREIVTEMLSQAIALMRIRICQGADICEIKSQT